MLGDKHRASRKKQLFDHKTLKRLHEAEHRPSHDQKWAQLDADQAAFARRAVVRAGQIREAGLDPGDAYLQGIADLRASQIRQQLIDSFNKPDYIVTDQN